MPWILAAGSPPQTGEARLRLHPFERRVEYANDFFTRSGVNGECRKRRPVNSMIAFEIVGAISGVAICPAPVG